MQAQRAAPLQALLLLGIYCQMSATPCKAQQIQCLVLHEVRPPSRLSWYSACSEHSALAWSRASAVSASVWAVDSNSERAASSSAA